MNPIQCALSIPPVRGLDDNLTVGRVFVWTCEGNFSGLNASKAELRTDAPDKYKLRLLGIEQKTESEIVLRMTSHLVGAHDLKAVQLVDSEHSYVLGDLSFKVQSVIEKTEEKVEPFGPMGPLQLNLSPLYFVLPALTLALLGFAFWRWLSCYRERKAAIRDVMKLGAGLTPMAELGRDLRVLQRNLNEQDQTAIRKSVEQLQNCLKMFLARELLLPIVDAPNEKVIAELKKYKKDLYKTKSAELRLLLAEMQRAQAAQKHLSIADVEQLIHTVRKFADQVEAGGPG